MKQKFLDLAGLTAYDRMIKEWFKAGVVDITDEAIQALFVTVAEGPADNEIWYTSIDGNSVYAETPEGDKEDYNPVIISNIYENGKGVITFQDPITRMPTDSAGETLFTNWKTNNAERLSTIILPKSVKNIGPYSLVFDKSNLQYIEVQETIEMVFVAGNFPMGSNHNIKYNGTKAQWNNVILCYPDEVERPITVHCTDGDIVIPAA